MDDNAGERTTAWFHRVWRRGIMRSGLGTGLVLALAAIAFILAYRQHAKGNFHKLKERMAEERPQASAPRPGGQEALQITRTPLMEERAPEFLAVTMLPGRGMNVLQIRAYIPGKGEMDLMDSPSVDDAARQMLGTGTDAHGEASLAMGGAFSVPWAGRIWRGGGELDGHAATAWNGETMPLPSGEAFPLDGGLLLDTPADSSDTSTLPDGGQAEASFHGFGRSWPSSMDIEVEALLSGHTIDFTVTARNTGNVSAPVGIGWVPRFAIAKGTRSQLRLRIPGTARVEQGERNNHPTGRLVPTAGTAFDFSNRDGAPLPSAGEFDECFADLEQAVLDNGPVAELIDPPDGYRLRLTALSSEIKAIRVQAPANGSYVTIGPQFNYPDPFGHEWEKGAEGSGIVTLPPGQAVQWKVRLEILPLHDTAGTL